MMIPPRLVVRWRHTPPLMNAYVRVELNGEPLWTEQFPYEKQFKDKIRVLVGALGIRRAVWLDRWKQAKVKP